MTNTAPKIQYLAPIATVTIGIAEPYEVSFVEVAAARTEPAVCHIDIPDSRRQLHGAFARNDDVIVDWGYKGFELQRVFTGVVRDVEETERLIRIQCLDLSVKLFDTGITRTYQDETPTTIARALLSEAGIEDADLEALDDVVERLPLVNNTVAEAFFLLNRITDFQQAGYFDHQGSFHWRNRDAAEHSGYSLTYGENVLELKPTTDGVYVVTVGLPVFHSSLVDITDQNGATRTYFIEQVKHTLGPAKKGSRTALWLTEVE